MVFRIVISGESQCEMYAQVSMVADYLSQHLPDFCYELIEKSVLEWQTWLGKINAKNKWHHCSSPLIWKELLVKGSKPYYIGGAAEFMEYCNSYYEFESYCSLEMIERLVKNNQQLKKKIRHDTKVITDTIQRRIDEESEKSFYTICISGAANPLTMHLISGLLEMSTENKSISKIYIYDQECSQDFMEYVEHECSYVGTNFSAKVVKHVDKMGLALTQADVLIVLDHVAFDEEKSIGHWLTSNTKIMNRLARMINASGSPKMRIIFANLGPACYNATKLIKLLVNFDKYNIVVATSDLGMEIAPIAAKIADIPMKDMFCPPVWGFVGINHLVDIRTTIYKYNTFEPYNRYSKVKNSSLKIGCISPEVRTMECLMFWDNTLWSKVAARPKTKQIPLNKAEAILNIAKLWLFEPGPNDIVNLGVWCDGSFGLNFQGIFSQPTRFKDGKWIPASDYFQPKDPQMKLKYLEQIAEQVMDLKPQDLPPIVPYYPCYCKPKFYKKKNVW